MTKINKLYKSNEINKDEVNKENNYNNSIY